MGIDKLTGGDCPIWSCDRLYNRCLSLGNCGDDDDDIVEIIEGDDDDDDIEVIANGVVGCGNIGFA